MAKSGQRDKASARWYLSIGISSKAGFSSSAQFIFGPGKSLEVVWGFVGCSKPLGDLWTLPQLYASNNHPSSQSMSWEANCPWEAFFSKGFDDSLWTLGTYCWIFDQSKSKKVIYFSKQKLLFITPSHEPQFYFPVLSPNQATSSSMSCISPCKVLSAKSSVPSLTCCLFLTMHHFQSLFALRQMPSKSLLSLISHGPKLDTAFQVWPFSRDGRGAISCLALNIVLLLMYLCLTLVVFLATTSHR